MGTGPAGRCIFFNPQLCACGLEEEYGRGHKPIICLLTYCTIFASRGGKLYLKVRARKVGSSYEMIYKEASEEERKWTVQKVGSAWRRARPKRTEG